MTRLRVRPRDVLPGDLLTRYPRVGNVLQKPVQCPVTEVKKFKDSTRGGTTRYKIYFALPEGMSPNYMANRMTVSPQASIWVERQEG
jgi:hypothetical protein